ncbi:MAG: hypothetical protein ACREA7_07895 [Nitrosotalea sp.]
MLSETSDLERWIISDVAIKELRENSQGRWWNHPITSVGTIILQVPPSLLPDSDHEKVVRQSLIHLIGMNLLQPVRSIDEDGCRITLEGIGMFRKHLLPAKIVKDKKLYNNLVDRIDGNPTIKRDLKKLGDKLRDRLEDEAIEEFVKFAMKAGSDALLYYVHMTHH